MPGEVVDPIKNQVYETNLQPEDPLKMELAIRLEMLLCENQAIREKVILWENVDSILFDFILFYFSSAQFALETKIDKKNFFLLSVFASWRYLIFFLKRKEKKKINCSLQIGCFETTNCKLFGT